MMSLDIDPKIEIGTKVKLIIKPSHVAIAKDLQGEVSYSNILKSKIISCHNGEVLSSIKLGYFDATIESIITLNSSKRMGLKEGDEVLALIKASEISIGEIVDA
jgi:molybdopterin-binding protein